MKLWLPETKAQREKRLTGDIAATHQQMAGMVEPVGNLARLYDRLHAVAERTDVFDVNGLLDVDRQRAMYIGGVVFGGYTDEGGAVRVDIRRTTTRYSRGGGHAEMSIFFTTAESRIRARLFTSHRDGSWQSEGSTGTSADRASYMSRSSPEFKDMRVVGQLVGDVALLAAHAYSGVVQAELPATPHQAPPVMED
jgi:hypothetical protein